ncbi:MAG: efflux RND transporter periplasmic adaptor subunit, partial [Salegentibacter sp.]
MKKLNQNTRNIVTGVAFLLVGLLLGWLFFGGDSVAPAKENAAEVAEQDQVPNETLWTCAMHPQVREKEPGNCPICGMDLIPLEDASGDTNINQLDTQMSEAAVQLGNIQTSVVTRQAPEKTLDMPGKVKADERRVEAVTSRFPGRIEKLYVNFTGQEVKRGQRLASVYSPALVTAQKELFEASRFKESNPGFYTAAVNKLKLWDLSDGQIQNILESREPVYNFDIRSKQSGTVLEKKVEVGDYLKEGQSLFQISNLNSVWVVFDAYESDLPWIKEGDQIKFTVKSIPGKTFESEVTFIDPVIDPATRVAAVRTEVKNAEGLLKPGMFARGIVQSEIKDVQNALSIPQSAVLWTGKRAVVYVKKQDTEKPVFEFREIDLGPEAGDYYLVNDGLQEGDEIVTNGTFKVDAAAQLQGKASMMNPEVKED